VTTPVSRAFAGPAAFRAWLKKHHATERELLVRLCKARVKDRGLTYREALDEALCFGWIDGVRRRVDEDTFSVRFTPRKPKSKWSAVNVRRVGELRKEKRMQPAGQAAFAARVESGYSYESRPQALAPEFVKRFRARPRAWRYFESRPPWYRRTSSFWVMSAKKPETRERRLQVLIESCDKEAPVPPLVR
jgi:uncharacterized protein YdeI (YjbR/CyaY-like superfamily)